MNHFSPLPTWHMAARLHTWQLYPACGETWSSNIKFARHNKHSVRILCVLLVVRQPGHICLHFTGCKIWLEILHADLIQTNNNDDFVLELLLRRLQLLRCSVQTAVTLGETCRNYLCGCWRMLANVLANLLPSFLQSIVTPRRNFASCCQCSCSAATLPPPTFSP